MAKRRRMERGIDVLWRREVGDLAPRTFAHRVGASEDMVLRLEIYRKLTNHRGCVNTVSFNTYGDILVSGSDDTMVLLWNWDAGSVKLAFHSGHMDNVFQAKVMPCTDDRTLVTCAADGQVRCAMIQEDGKVDTAKLGEHDGRAHKLAIEPGSPHIFYSCGEDGLVQHFDLRTRNATRLFGCQSMHTKSTLRPIVCLNTMAIDPRNPNLFAAAGSDEYARLYDIRMCRLDGSNHYDRIVDCFCPPHLIGDSHVGITGLAFSDKSELLVSYTKELIYLFSKGMGIGTSPHQTSDKDTAAKPAPRVFSGHRNFITVKGVNFFGPSCEYVVSGSDCGRVFMWRKRDSELLRAMDGDKHIVNCIEPHPHATILATSGIESDVKIWTPRAIKPATLPVNIKELKRKKRWLSYIPAPSEMIEHVMPMVRGDSDLSTEELAQRLVILEYFMGLRNDGGDSGDIDNSFIGPEKDSDSD